MKRVYSGGPRLKMKKPTKNAVLRAAKKIQN